MNYGVQLATEEQTMKLESVVLKAIGMAKEGLIVEQQQEHRLTHLARTGQTTEAFQLMNDKGAASEAMLMLRIHLPDNQSTMMRMLPSTDLGTALRMICDKRNLDPSIHAVQKPAFQGSSLYEQVELPTVAVKDMGINEIVIKCLSTMVGDKSSSSKVDQVKLLVSHAQHSATVKMVAQEDLIVQVHLPDGGKTMIKLPANTSMGEMLFHIAEKRDLDVGSVEMASSASGKKKMSVKGTIGQNKISTVYLVNKKKAKGSSSSSSSSSSNSSVSANSDSGGSTVSTDTHRLTSLLAEGVPIHDPRIPVGWQLLLAKSSLGEECMRDPKQRQLVIDLVERSGGLEAVLALDNAEIEARFAKIDDFRRQKTIMTNAVAPPMGSIPARSNAIAPPTPPRSRRKAPAVPPPPQSNTFAELAAPSIPARAISGPKSTKPTPRARGSTFVPAPAPAARPAPPVAAPKPMPKPMPRARPSTADAAAAPARPSRAVVPGGVDTSMCELDELRGKLASRGATTSATHDVEEEGAAEEVFGVGFAATESNDRKLDAAVSPAKEFEDAFVTGFPSSIPAGFHDSSSAGEDDAAAPISPALSSASASAYAPAASESGIDSELLTKLAARSHSSKHSAAPLHASAASDSMDLELLSKLSARSTTDDSTAENAVKQQQFDDDDDLDSSFIMSPPPPPPPPPVAAGARRFFGSSAPKGAVGAADADADANANAASDCVVLPPPPSAFGGSHVHEDAAEASNGDAAGAAMLPPPPPIFGGDTVPGASISTAKASDDDNVGAPSKLAAERVSSLPTVPPGFGDNGIDGPSEMTVAVDFVPVAFSPLPPLIDGTAEMLGASSIPPPSEYVPTETDVEATEASDAIMDLPTAGLLLPPAQLLRGGSLTNLPPPPAELSKGLSSQQLDLDSLPPPPSTPPPPSSPLPPPAEAESTPEKDVSAAPSSALAPLQPPAPPPMPPSSIQDKETVSIRTSKLGAGQRRGSASLVEALSKGSVKLKKVGLDSRGGDSRARTGSLDSRTALLVSLGSFGKGRSSLRKTPSKSELDKVSPRRRASSVQESISMVLDSRRSAFVKRDSVVKSEEDDDAEWE